MATKKKNVDDIEGEKTVKRRTTRKAEAKYDDNASVSPLASSDTEIVSIYEKNVHKNNDAPQANPGRFTAEMLIAMGKQLEEDERVKDVDIKSLKDESEELRGLPADVDDDYECYDEFVEDDVADGHDVDETEDVAGREFTYRGMNFIALGESTGGILAISAEILDRKMRFADNADKGSNDWKKSSLRKKLNSEHINNFRKDDLLPVISDLTADTGEDNYGKCEDYIAIPSDNMFRKFHKIIPVYPTWVWSLTPWAIEYGTLSAAGARTSAKTIYSEQVNRELGVAIVCRFNRNAIDF